jgi:acyl dehydratase
VRFSDFYIGQVLEAGPYVITEAAIVAFAQQFDPQWFHVNSDVASESSWKGLIASGWHTCSIAMRLAFQAALQHGDSSGSPGIDYINWPQPVRPGDSLQFRATVIEKRSSNSRPNLGIIKWRWEMLNQHGAQVLDLVANSFFDKEY